MGNIFAKSKKKPKRSNRSRHRNRKREYTRSNSRRNDHSRRYTSNQSQIGDYHPNRFRVGGYGSSYRSVPSSNWLYTHGRPIVSPSVENRVPPSSGSYAYVPRISQCTCHARFGISSKCPASLSSSAVPRSVSGSKKGSSWTKEKYSGSATQSERDGSEKRRGMIVYKNGKEEKRRMLEDEKKPTKIEPPLYEIESDNTGDRQYIVTKPQPLDERRGYVKAVESDPNHEKNTFIAKFWHSPLGRKLPIGGPLGWLRPRMLQPLSENAVVDISRKVVARKKPRSLWSNIKRRFLWKTPSKRRRSSTSAPDGQEAEILETYIEPTSPSRHAPSRQYVWKTISSPISHLDEDQLDVIELSPSVAVGNASAQSNHLRTKEYRSENSVPKVDQQRCSPFFASKYTWRSPSTLNETPTNIFINGGWIANDGTANGSKFNDEENTSHYPRSYLWRNNGVTHSTNRLPQGWVDEATLYHHS